MPIQHGAITQMLWCHTETAIAEKWDLCYGYHGTQREERLTMDEMKPGGMPTMMEMDISDVGRKYLDIPYCSQSPAQKLDIFLPDTGTGPYPVVINIHGGGFESGIKRETMMRPMLEGTRQYGFAYVLVEYRLTTEAPFPACLDDIKAAIRFLRANAAEYHLAGEKIAVMGSSAGGYLAAAAAATGDNPLYEDKSMGNPSEHTAVTCCVTEYGVFDISRNDEMVKGDGFPVTPPPPGAPVMDENAGVRMLDQFLGFRAADNPGLQRFICVYNMVTATMPPILIQHGDRDNVASPRQSIRLRAVVDAVCGPGRAELDLIPGNSHIGPDFYTGKNIDRVMCFIQSQFEKG